MKLENQVPSLELCKKLKSVSYPQEGLFWWRYSPEYGVQYGKGETVAPTVAEMGEWLAKFFLWYRSQPVIMKEGWKHHEQKLKLIPIDEANIRAGALIWLVENDYIDFKETK